MCISRSALETSSVDEPGERVSEELNSAIKAQYGSVKTNRPDTIS